MNIVRVGVLRQQIRDVAWNNGLCQKTPSGSSQSAQVREAFRNLSNSISHSQEEKQGIGGDLKLVLLSCTMHSRAANLSHCV